MTTLTSGPHTGQIHALLAEHGYEVSPSAPGTFEIREPESGVAIQAVLEGDIVFFSLVCTVTPRTSLTPRLLERMLAADNGVATSYFQLYDAGNGNVAVALNNFCKLQGMGPEDRDDILSCIHFLLADVLSARRVLAGLN